MSSSIQKLLQKYYTDGSPFTHVSLIKPKGKYRFDRQGLEEFWAYYNELIFKNKTVPMGIGEKPQQYLPVLGDIDLKIRDTDEDIADDKLYTEEQVRSVISIYQNVLRTIVDECTDEKLTCVLLEKKLYTVTKNEITYLKNGFHIHFPYCFLSKQSQELHLIPRVKDLLKEENTFSNLKIEDSGSVVDKSCCSVAWLLYGSRKSEDTKPYVVSKIYNAEMNEIDMEKAFRKYQIFNNRTRLIKIKGKVKEYLPQILSIIPYDRKISEVKLNLPSPLREKIKTQEKAKKTYKYQDTREKMEIAKKLMPLLADFRASEYGEWMTVGWALYNISEGS